MGGGGERGTEKTIPSLLFEDFQYFVLKKDKS